jgi:ABC-type phosphate transport system auxiliary subunit
VARNKTFIVRFKPAELQPQLIIAERAEFQGEHLVFLDSSGQFVALLLSEIVESWSEFDQTFEA